MKLKKISALLFAIIMVLTLALCFSTTVFAEEPANTTEVTVAAEETEETEDNGDIGTKALAAAIVVGIASAAGAIAMGIAIAKSAESIARQPEASGKINSAMMLGLVFIETLIIYALIVAILIIFVL